MIQAVRRVSRGDLSEFVIKNVIKKLEKCRNQLELNFFWSLIKKLSWEKKLPKDCEESLRRDDASRMAVTNPLERD